MKQNIYDNKVFFDKYSQMARSVKGLEGAGEWETLQAMLPSFKDKRVLDLGCGFGWHCQYAIEHGASKVVGVDISSKMLKVAKAKTTKTIEYMHESIDKVDFPTDSFDVVISSLAFHYLPSIDKLMQNISRWLCMGGNLVFSVEHPIFTSYGTQDWYRDPDGNILHFPVDHYFYEGKREAVFLGQQVTKYHRTLTTYLSAVLSHKFELVEVVEPMPSKTLLETVKGMSNELRRPMMLLVSARKI